MSLRQWSIPTPPYSRFVNSTTGVVLQFSEGNEQAVYEALRANLEALHNSLVNPPKAEASPPGPPEGSISPPQAFSPFGIQPPGGHVGPGGSQAIPIRPPPPPHGIVAPQSPQSATPGGAAFVAPLPQPPVAAPPPPPDVRNHGTPPVQYAPQVTAPASPQPGPREGTIRRPQVQARNPLMPGHVARVVAPVVRLPVPTVSIPAAAIVAPEGVHVTTTEVQTSGPIPENGIKIVGGKAVRSGPVAVLPQPPILAPPPPPAGPKTPPQ
jgi:hypothetical protein